MVAVDKAQERAHPEVNPKYVCAIIDAELFIIGYGLDYNQRCRNLPFICAVDTAYLPNEAERSQLLRKQGALKEYASLKVELAKLVSGDNWSSCQGLFNSSMEPADKSRVREDAVVMLSETGLSMLERNKRNVTQNTDVIGSLGLGSSYS
jgi:hypothetical protein